MDRDSYLTGENAAYLEELLQELHDDPDAVDSATRLALEPLNGTLAQGPTIAPRSIFHARGAAPDGAGAVPTDLASAERQAKVARFINGYRVHGHWAADVDPLDTKEIAKHPEL